MNRRTNGRALAISLLTFGVAAWGANPPAPPAPATPAPAAPAATNAIGPKIQFATTVHDFGRAKSGEVVKYIYIFTNAGDQLLEVTGVQACGCITADWTKKVEPGNTGSIPIGFNSTGYGGQLTKVITLTCNDRANPRPMLQLKGTIWKPIDVIPQFAVLNLTADVPLASATVIITNNLPEPVTLSGPECNNPAFAAELQTNQPGREFRLVIAPVKPLPPGNAQTQVILKTSSTNMPVITITAFANVQPALSINPPQIVLPPAPLAQPQTNVVNVTFNTTNLVVLSEPNVNAAGVGVELKEPVPGRSFTATLTFPQGFELAAGQKTELNIKSSLPAVPVVKVSILQTPRPAPVPVVQARQAAAAAPRTNRHRPLPPIDLPPLPP